MNRSTFRKEALQHLSSPDQLDQLIQITNLPSWLFLAACIGIVCAGLAWGIFGSITTSIQQVGALTRSNPVLAINAPAIGQIMDIQVEVGDSVQAGDVVAHLFSLEQQIEITSPASGRILSIRVSGGTTVDTNSPVVTLEALDQPQQTLDAVTYLTLEQVQQVETGMTVRVIPISAQAQTNGYLEGRVTSVAQIPAAFEEILLVYPDPQLVEALLNQGPLVEVRIQLLSDENGGFLWSTSQENPFTPVTGSPAQITIVTSEERPINQIIPS
jgi:pyruvate/2-oxoglutarate dehydrogenase complex dihydrolipoamide acyltransferase (E2) component